MSNLGLYPEELVTKKSTLGGLPEIKCNSYIKGFLNKVMEITSN